MSYRLPQANGELKYRQDKSKSFRALPVDRPLEQATKILSSDEPKWIELDSENIKQISYDRAALILKVVFRNSPIEYRYYEVSKTLFENLQEADSPSAYLRRFVVPSHRVRRFQP